MKYRDLLKDAEALIDLKAPPLKIKNPGLIARWGNYTFPMIPPKNDLTLSDILSGHGETKGSD